jgi:hypothetical protein
MRLIKYFLILLPFLFACKKDKVIDKVVVNQLYQGALVLNEGLFQQNNSSLSWIDYYDYSSQNEFFEIKSGRKLGDTGNDMQLYGGKIYIVVNVSSTVEVLDSKTGLSIKQITFSKLNGSPKQPRSITFHGGKAFVSCFDGFVDVIDTSTLLITNRIPVGLNPDQIAIAGNKILVSNSGGLNSPIMDSTISIIDPVTEIELQRIVVGKNPGLIKVIGDYAFIHVRGNYGSVPSKFLRIDLNNLSVSEEIPLNIINFEKMGSELLLAYLENNEPKIGTFDPVSKTFTNPNLISLSGIETLYNMQYNPVNQHIYLVDAKGFTFTGSILEYNSNGTYIRQFNAGLNPNSILFF